MKKNSNAKAHAEYMKLRIRMAEASVAYQDEMARMPEWAKAVAIDRRVPVSAKVAHEGLDVETWTSRQGAEMSRVHWADGTTTQYEGDLSRKYVAWDR